MSGKEKELIYKILARNYDIITRECDKIPFPIGILRKCYLSDNLKIGCIKGLYLDGIAVLDEISSILQAHHGNLKQFQRRYNEYFRRHLPCIKRRFSSDFIKDNVIY